MAFTFYQVPILLHTAVESRIEVHRTGGQV